MTLNAIQYQNGYLLVDNSKVYNEDMYYSTGFKEVYKAVVDEPKEVSDRRDFKIIAQSPELSIPDIPYVEVEDDAERIHSLALDEALIHNKLNGVSVLDLIPMFIAGYKTAQAKKYSEEDVLIIRNKLVSMLPTGDVSTWDMVQAVSAYTKWFDEYIQSLQPKIVSIELEMKFNHYIIVEGKSSDIYIPVTYQKDGRTFLKVKQINYDTKRSTRT